MRPDELRDEVCRLLDLESKTLDHDEKMKLALLAFALAQEAEALSHALPQKRVASGLRRARQQVHPPP